MIKTICLCLVSGGGLALISVAVESDYIIKFSKNNLLILLVALLAIQVSTVSFVLSKIRDLQMKVDANFDNTIDEIEKTIKEQMALIAVAAVVLIFTTSKVAMRGLTYHNLIADVLLSAVLAYEILIIWDTAKSVFQIARIRIPSDSG